MADFKPIPTDGRFQDLTGRIFERWTVIGFAGKRDGAHWWLCECQCGTRREIRAKNLKRRHSKSCGCLTQPPIEERIWSKVVKQEGDGCWLWTGATTEFGYGAMTIKGKHHDAHRLVYILTHGQIPPGLFVLHNCDNPRCCRPDHLRLGTPQDNMDDRAKRGKAAKKLTPEKVMDIYRSIRDETATANEAAKKHGVTGHMARLIGKGKAWQHVTRNL